MRICTFFKARALALSTVVPLTIVALIIVALTIAVPRPALAQDLTLEQATAMLRSTSHDEIQLAIMSFGLLGNPRAVGPLSERIRDGLAPDLLESAIDTLTVLGRPEAGPVLFELTTHRRPEVRLRAVQAIAACRVRNADRALVSSLSDSSPEVRAAAATALGELDATGAMESLFLAFDRGVPEAGPSIGRLARPEHVARILESLGRVPFTQMRVVLGALLARRDIPSRSKLDVIARLLELATADVRSFLEELLTTVPMPANDPVRRAAEDAITRIAQ